MKRWLMEMVFGGAGGASIVADVGLLLLRVVSGLAMAFAHGLGKMPPPQRFVEGVADMGFPMPGFFAWAAGLSEFAGGLLLAIGLATRPAALFIGITMWVAFFIRHRDDPFGVAERALLFLVIALAFLLTGAGRYSVDALIHRRKARTPAAHR